MVAFFAARLDGGPPTAAMTLTLRRTRSAANSGRRSALPSAQRYSMATFWPTMIAALLQAQPERGQLRLRIGADAPLCMNPITASPAAARAPLTATRPPRRREA